MTPRTTRASLWFATATLLLLAVAGLLLTAMMPLQNPAHAHAPQTRSTAAGSEPAAPDLTLASFEPVWGLDLRRPLYDPPRPAAPGPAPGKRPAVPLQLIGTMVEDGHSVAMFTTAQGGIELLGVGQKHEGLEVLRIAEGTVTARHAGAQVTMTVED